MPSLQRGRRDWLIDPEKQIQEFIQLEIASLKMRRNILIGFSRLKTKIAERRYSCFHFKVACTCNRRKDTASA